MSRRRHSAQVAPSIPLDEREAFAWVRSQGDHVLTTLELHRALHWPPDRAQRAVDGLKARGWLRTTSRGFVRAQTPLRGNTTPPSAEEVNRPTVYPEVVAHEDLELDDLLRDDHETVIDPVTERRHIADLVDPPHFPDGLDGLVRAWLARRSSHAQAAIGEADLDDLVERIRARDRT